MSPPDSDPARALAVAVLAAAFAGDAVARMHGDIAAEADTRQRRWLRENLGRELRAATAELRRLRPPPHAYWETADPGTLAEDYRLARTWAPFDDAAAAAERWLRSELAARFGIAVPPMTGAPLPTTIDTDDRQHPVNAVPRERRTP